MKEEKKNINGKELNNDSLEKVVGGNVDLNNTVDGDSTNFYASIDDVDYVDTKDVTDDIEKRI